MSISIDDHQISPLPLNLRHIKTSPKGCKRSNLMSIGYFNGKFSFVLQKAAPCVPLSKGEG